MNYNISNPKDKLKQLKENLSKYSLGSECNKINEIKELKPFFAFDYLSLNKSFFCFNSNLISLNDYKRFFDRLKTLSDLTWQQMSVDKSFHFHDVDFSEITSSESDFVKCLSKKNTQSEDIMPTVYQFKIFEEARIYGFFYKGVFYLVWFDRNHNNYKRK